MVLIGGLTSSIKLQPGSLFSHSELQIHGHREILCTVVIISLISCQRKLDYSYPKIVLIVDCVRKDIDNKAGRLIVWDFLCVFMCCIKECSGSHIWSSPVAHRYSDFFLLLSQLLSCIYCMEASRSQGHTNHPNCNFIEFEYSLSVPTTWLST